VNVSAKFEVRSFTRKAYKAKYSLVNTQPHLFDFFVFLSDRPPGGSSARPLHRFSLAAGGAS